MNKVCELCGEIENLEKHHLNYKENKTILVCPNCHKKIHRSKQYPELLPNDKREWTFVQLNRKTAFRIRRRPGAKFGDTYETIIVRLLDKLDTIEQLEKYW